MKKNTLTLITCLFINSLIFSQLKVDQGGRVGIGTNWPNVDYKCDIRGNLLLTNYPTTPNYALVIKLGNGFPGTEIGVTTDQLAFWESNTGYNKLYAEDYFKMSDSTLKSNIVPIKQGLDKIMKLNAYSYELENITFSAEGERIDGRKQEYGFLSQEIEKMLPDVKITDDVKGVKLMDYDQIIPLLVAATKEQQLLIESLKNEIADLKTNNNTNDYSNGSHIKGSSLQQNRPNPFQDNTVIDYSIEENNFRSASIVIFDMNGALIKSYVINNVKSNQLKISGGELKAGMYIYTLIVNEKEVDTKRMILL